MKACVFDVARPVYRRPRGFGRRRFRASGAGTRAEAEQRGGSTRGDREEGRRAGAPCALQQHLHAAAADSASAAGAADGEERSSRDRLRRLRDPSGTQRRSRYSTTCTSSGMTEYTAWAVTTSEGIIVIDPLLRIFGRGGNRQLG